VSFTAARQGRCGAVTASVSGANVSAAAFYVNRRFVRTDTRSPFRATLRFKARSVVRARVTTAFDQVVTIDRVVRGC
jgi:hypothetical protein